MSITRTATPVRMRPSPLPPYHQQPSRPVDLNRPLILSVTSSLSARRICLHAASVEAVRPPVCLRVDCVVQILFGRQAVV